MSILGRLRHVLETVSERGSVLEHPRARRLGILLAFAAFCVGFVLAFRAHPGLLDDLDYGAWVLVLCLVPVTFLGNALQFLCTAGLLGTRIGLSRAMFVTVLSAGANMLPLPGGSLVRIAALKTETNTYRQTTFTTLLVAGCWLAVVLVLAGGALINLGFPRAGAVLLVSGLAALGTFASGVLLTSGRIVWLPPIIAVQAGIVAVGALRLWFCFKAIGDPVYFFQTVVLTLSDVLASLVGVAPAGLGVTEFLAAGIAKGLGIAASFGFLAAALNRISSMLVVGPAPMFLQWLDSGRRGRGVTGAADTSRD